MAEREYIPVSQVQEMAAKGLSEAEIITRLKTKGFTEEQINKAMRQAIKAAVEKKEERVAPSPARPAEIASAREQKVSRRPEIRPMPVGRPAEKITVPEKLRPMEAGEGAKLELSLEEVVEAVVEEKWKEFLGKLEAFEKRDKQLMSLLKDLQEKLGEERATEEKTGATLKDELQELSESVADMRSRTAALEKAFKEFSKYIKKK